MCSCTLVILWPAFSAAHLALSDALLGAVKERGDRQPPVPLFVTLPEELLLQQ